MAAFGRVITALVTPFDRQGRVDYGRAGELARRLAAAGSDGIMVCGTTGESPTLSPAEKLKLLEAVRSAVDGAAFVWCGTGNNSTADSTALTRKATDAGAQGVMAVVPYYNKPPQEGLYQHFHAIAAATPLPVMLYNVPGRTSCNLLPATVARLSQVENIVGIKEASGNLDQVSEVRRLTPERFLIWSGDDSLTLPILACGGCGVVSVASHVAAAEIRQLVDSFAAGDTVRAASLHQRLLPLFKAMFVTTNPIPVKVALRLAGFDVGGYRLPLVEPSEHEVAQVRRVMAEMGLLQEPVAVAGN